MESETVPEKIGASIQNILFHLLGRGAKESEIRSFYEKLRLIRLGNLIGITNLVNQFRGDREVQKARLLLQDTASILKELSKLYGEENRFREAFEGLSIEFSKLHETIEEDTEFPYKLEQLRVYLTEVDQVAEFYESIAERSKIFEEYVTLLRSSDVT